MLAKNAPQIALQVVMKDHFHKNKNGLNWKLLADLVDKSVPGILVIDYIFIMLDIILEQFINMEGHLFKIKVTL